MSLNKTQLVGTVATEAGLTRAEAEKAIKSAFGAIKEELSKGGNVTLIGFGTFSILERAARTGKNPRTGESIKIPARKVARFRPGKALVEVLMDANKKPAAAAKAEKKPVAKKATAKKK
jgi:DNA-binding protein HU-beta